MTFKLKPYQQKIVDADPKKCGIFLGTGCGKTVVALSLSRGTTLVIAPKTTVLDRTWHTQPIQKEVTVISKETFRRDHATLPHFDTVIVDEAHQCLGAMPTVRYRNRQPIPKTSQLYDALTDYLARTSPTRLYLVTATPIRSPMTVWAAARVLGHSWDFYAFRDAFYFRLPMPGRDVYTPKSDAATKDRLAAAVKKLGFTGRITDFFDSPDQIYRTDRVPLSPEQEKRIDAIFTEYPDPLVAVGKTLQVENGVLAGDEFNPPETFDNAKLDRIEDYSYEFERVVVFCRYIMQIEAIKDRIKHKKVFVLTGDTKDRLAVLAAARKEKEYVFIASAQISAGWELPECDVMIFASMTYSVVDRIQAEGRIQRMNNIKKNLYVTLVTKGGIDEMVAKTIENKVDFNERIYAEKYEKARS